METEQNWVRKQKLGKKISGGTDQTLEVVSRATFFITFSWIVMRPVVPLIFFIKETNDVCFLPIFRKLIAPAFQ